MVKKAPLGVDTMETQYWKVGELARRTGLSVRTLHYYDEIGLLSPTHRTASAHRVYAAPDVVRLQQIVSLRQLGFALEEVRNFLDGRDTSTQCVIQLHVARLQEQVRLQQQLCRRLETIAARLDVKADVSVDEFMKTIQEIEMLEKLPKYYTPEQRQFLEERRAAVGEDRIKRAESDWKQLIAQVRAEMDEGTDPASKPVLLLARQWSDLIAEFTGGDPGIGESLGKVWQGEPGLRENTGIDAEMFEYIGKAMAALKDE